MSQPDEILGCQAFLQKYARQLAPVNAKIRLDLELIQIPLRHFGKSPA